MKILIGRVFIPIKKEILIFMCIQIRKIRPNIFLAHDQFPLVVVSEIAIMIVL